MDLPKRSLGCELLGLFWNEVREHLVLGRVLVGGVEHSLDFDVSESLVEIDRQEELALLPRQFGRWHNYIALPCLELAASRDFFLTLDGRHVHERILVEGPQILLARRELEYTHSCVVEGLWEWIGEVLALVRKSTSNLS